MVQEIKLLGGGASRYLAEQIAAHNQIPLIDASIKQFSDGEIHTRINESIRGAFVFFVQSTFAPSDNLMELLLLIDAAKRASAQYITAVIPYFGYARQDRKDKPRVPITAKLIANLLTAAGANRVMTMDLHAPQIQGFFDIPVDHLASSAIFVPYIQEQNIDDLIFAAPDVGSTKRTRHFASYFDAEMVICDKYRSRHNEVADMRVIGEVKDRNVVIIDDIVDTAGTLCKAAEILLDKGAKSVRAVCTHPVLSGNAYERIANSPLTELTVCNTIPLQQEAEKIKVLSVSKLFAIAINRVVEHKSLNSLFLSHPV